MKSLYFEGAGDKFPDSVVGQGESGTNDVEGKA
jgi:hypothetical protein